MANREELAIIRNARAGQVAAQLELGKLYLFGSAGLPQSLPTALHWLERAARQDCPPAWQLIGNHIPLELAQRNAAAVAQWYERAYDDGSLHAGLVYAQLVLDAQTTATPHPKAVQALEDAARAGFAHAQWMLAQRQDNGPAAQPGARTAPPDAARQTTHAPETGARMPGRPPAPAPQRRAPPHGAGAPHDAALDAAWTARRLDDYLAHALPRARALAGERGEQGEMRRFAPDEITLLSRCARLLDPALDGVSGLAALDAGAVAALCQAGEPAVFWELAAAEHDPHAQLALGLRCARMRVDGRRCTVGASQAHVANFKKAIRWLTLAGEQGLAEAWYALSRIYIKPEFSQRNVADAQRYLERAAEMGYRDAQLECGHNAWRARRENENNDVRAVYWLQKAAAQGSPEAVELLRKIAPRAASAPYTETGRLLDSHADALAAHPLLAARIELAALFDLSRAEALLLDVGAADQGHCLVIDIRASYGRSKRRLVMVDSAHERQVLDRIVHLFEQVDCGPSGPEGNYRQRLYRLRTVLNVALPGNDDDGGGDIELAA
ncbi:tetratricopeptide repeat protein [Massilia puerhi]|uniref:tetratricopeptide repeat protein n=1 Tax=Massilia puerhi TaxID=2681550 RepID=UPI00135970F1|nr:SEL1-like repeat protein [Massilia puerhi]